MLTTTEAAYNPNQFWVAGAHGQTLEPIETADAIKADGAATRVPTNGDLELAARSGKYLADIVWMLEDNGNLLAIAMHGTNTEVNSLRSCALTGTKDADSLWLQCYDPKIMRIVVSKFIRVSPMTGQLVKNDKRGIWSKQSAKGDNTYGVFYPTYVKENTMPDEHKSVFTLVDHKPGETTESVKERMKQAWFDSMRRATSLPLMPHKSADQPHPWAEPLFDYFLMHNEIRWLTTIGPMGTVFDVPADLKDIIKESVYRGRIERISHHIDFFDPSDK